MAASIALLIGVGVGCGRIDYELVERGADASPLDAARADVSVRSDSATDAPSRDAVIADGPSADGAPGADAPLVDGGEGDALVMWIECESAVGGRLDDSTSYMHHALCEPTGCPAIAAGRIGMACVLDGSEHLVVMDTSALATDDGFTVALWARPRVVPTSATALVSRPDPAGTVSDSWALFYQPLERPMLETYDGSTYVRLPGSSGSMPTGEWRHVAATFTPPDQRRLYIDGVEVVSDSSVAVQLGGRILIGADQDGDTVTHFFDGAIDDVRLYRRALDATEIAALAI